MRSLVVVLSTVFALVHVVDGFTTTSNSPLFRDTLRPIKSYITAFSASKRPTNICPVPSEATVEELESDACEEYIDEVVSSVSGTTKGDVILKYKPYRFWLLRQWTGTLLQHGFQQAGVLMCFSTITTLLLHKLTGGSWFTAESAKASVMVEFLKAFDRLWHYQLTLTTFILTFFVTNAYGFWKEMYKLARQIQGSLNDIGYFLSTHAQRGADGKIAPNTLEYLDDTARNVRLYHTLMWASKSRRLKVLLTDRGLNKLAAQGQITSSELDTLKSLDLPRSQLHLAVFQWLNVRFQRARRTGLLLEPSEGLAEIWLDILSELRGHAAHISHLEEGRMPLPYAHFVQFLVDSFLFTAPLALYVELGTMSIPCVGLLTLFYGGLLDLSKVFLDPLENEDFCDVGLEMDLTTLIRESNRSSRQWVKGVEKLSF